MLATVTVNASQVVRTVDPELLGVNLVEWDTNQNTAQTEQMVEAAGLNMFRFPGGSDSDDFHFNAPAAYGGQGTAATMASFISTVGGVGLATLDYGSGSPQEAAAFLAYLNAPVGNTTNIGVGGEWNDSTNTLQQVNWQTAGYWANLRASAPLAHDDGLNYLRLNHPAPYEIHYWEVGNEEYGSWETDHHGQGGDPGSPHDPTTYSNFFKQFATYASTIDPTISIGIDAGDPTAYNNWVGDIVQQSVTQGFTIGFISDHNYVQAPGSENDSTLLLDTVSDANSSDDWAVRAAGYESILKQDLGTTAASHVELLATEFNSVYSNPGKQTTSLVNGLFVADSLGSLLETPYNGADVWDLRNYYDNSNNNSSSLYGWRQAGDYGILGSPGNTAPASGTYIPYPTYFAEQLASKIIQANASVVQATSSDPNLSTYAVLEPNGHLDLMVINKSSAGALTGQFQVANFLPSGQATVWQYGETQDTAQSQSTTGQSALANSSTTFTMNGSSFSDSFPAYSMTVLDLSPVSGPTIVTAAAGTPNPVYGTTTNLTVLASDPAGASNLTYTWSTLGTPPAAVTFSANGTNAAQSTTATFTAVGSYNFQVIARDPSGLTATSTVTVVVNSLGNVPTVGDPGFEAVSVGSGYAYNPTGSAWTFTSSAGVSGNNSGFTAGNPVAPQGSQVAFLQGPGVITQAVAGWAGGSYTISFDAAQRGNYQASTQNFEVLVDGAVVGTFRPTGTAYQVETTGQFNVASGTHTIEFLGLDSAGGDNTVFLDAVSVAPVAQTPSVGDPGFEAVSVGNSYAYDPTGSPWNFSGQAGLSGNNSPFTAANPVAPQGSQVAFLQNLGTISQAVSGWAGGSYVISFDAARRGNVGGIQNFEVTVDGVVVASFTPSSTSYQVETTPSFTVAAGSHTIAFVGLNSAGGDDTDFLDAVSVAPVAQTPSVGDPGFEAVSVGNSYAYDPTGSPWNFSGQAGLSGNNSPFTAANPVAPQGSQVAFLQNLGTISQAVSGWAGGSYVISFDAARRGNVGGIQNFEVTVDGVVVASFTPSSTSYQVETTPSFTVAAGSHTIAFVGLNSAGGDDTDFLDAVGITPS